MEIGGYAIGYDIYKGNIFEGHTLIPFLEKISSKIDLAKPIVVADAGLLSTANIKILEDKGYEYILGARIKSESDKIKKQIIKNDFSNGQTICINKSEQTKLIIAFSQKRATKDQHNRNR